MSWPDLNFNKRQIMPKAILYRCIVAATLVVKKNSGGCGALPVPPASLSNHQLHNMVPYLSLSLSLVVNTILFIE